MKKVVTKYLSILLILLLAVTVIPTEGLAATVKNQTEVDFPEVSSVVPDGQEFVPGYRDVEGTTPENLISKSKPNKVTIPKAYHSKLEDLEKYPTTRSQNPYGTCWAHAALASAEFSMVEQGYADKTVDYSELALAYFTYNTVKDPFGGTDGDSNKIGSSWAKNSNFLSLGGNNLFTTRIFAGWTGAAAEADVPYEKAEEALKEGLASKYAYKSNAAVLKNAKVVNILSDPSSVKELIMEHGALAVAYCYDGLYDNGGSYYCPEYRTTNHAVAVVGWDDNYSKNNFKDKPEKNGAWLMRNSWSSNGNSIDGWSYFWLSYCDKSLDAAAYLYEFMPASEYDNLMQYDGAALSRPIGYKKAANIFKVHNECDEKLEAVQLCFLAYTDVSYKIEVYKNVTSTTNPTKGTKVTSATTSGKTTYTGIYTVPLKNAVTLDEGSKYSVVITVSGVASVEAESSANYGWIEVKASIDKGESFVYDSNSKKWVDYSKISAGLGNIALKALTSNVKMLDKPVVKAENTASSIKVTWNKVKDATKYKLYRRLKGTTSWGGSLKTYSSSDKLSFTDKDTKAGKTYQYKVVASNSKKTSSKTAIGAEITRLKKPTGVEAATGTNGEVIKWTKVTGAKGYDVYRKATSEDKYQLVGDVTTNRLVDKTAGYKKEYTYYVVAKAGDSTSIKSASVTKKISKLYPPAALKLEGVSTNAMQISWERREGVDGYYVYRATSKNGTYKKIKTIKSGDTVVYTNTGLTKGKTYYYKVKAYKGSKISAYSSVISMAPGLSQPTMKKTVNATESTIKIGWSKDTEASGYYVYRRKSPEEEWKKVKTITSKNTTSYTNEKVSGRYYYTVVSYKKSGDKTYTSTKAEAVDTTTLGKTQITGVYGNWESQSLGISWDKVANATGYQIYTSIDSDMDYKHEKTINNPDTTYEEFGVEPYVFTYMKVRAIYKSGGCTTYGKFCDHRMQ